MVHTTLKVKAPKSLVCQSNICRGLRNICNFTLSLSAIRTGSGRIFASNNMVGASEMLKNLLIHLLKI